MTMTSKRLTEGDQEEVENLLNEMLRLSFGFCNGNASHDFNLLINAANLFAAVTIKNGITTKDGYEKSVNSFRDQLLKNINNIEIYEK
jgi:hypothetical protein